MIGAGAVEESSHGPELGLGRGHGCGHGRSIRDVGGEIEGAHAGRSHPLEVGRQLGVGLGTGTAQEGEADAGRPREIEGALGRDPLAAAGDQQDVVRSQREGAGLAVRGEQAEHGHAAPSRLVIAGLGIAFDRGHLGNDPVRGLGKIRRDLDDADGGAQHLQLQGAGEAAAHSSVMDQEEADRPGRGEHGPDGFQDQPGLALVHLGRQTEGDAVPRQTAGQGRGQGVIRRSQHGPAPWRRNLLGMGEIAGHELDGEGAHPGVHAGGRGLAG